MIRRFRSATASSSLEVQLRKAKPVEAAWRASRYFEIGAENPHLMTANNKQIDGLWVCHCGEENHLIHYRGAHPFKQLNCTKCHHIMCNECRTSEIITPIPNQATEVFRSRFSAEGSEMAYCSVCQNCGLSHRATLSGGFLDFSVQECDGCMQSLSAASTGYYIGSLFNFRRDPEGTSVTLRLRRCITEPEDSEVRNNSGVCVDADCSAPLKPEFALVQAEADARLPQLPIPATVQAQTALSSHPPTPPPLEDARFTSSACRRPQKVYQTQTATTVPPHPKPQLRSQATADSTMAQSIQMECLSTGYKDLDAVMAQLRSMPGYKVRAV